MSYGTWIELSDTGVITRVENRPDGSRELELWRSDDGKEEEVRDGELEADTRTGEEVRDDT